MTETQQTSTTDPSMLPYRGVPTGEIVVSDAALLSLRKLRPWAMLFAIALFVYALAGGGIGSVWMAVMILKKGQPGFPMEKFIILTTVNLMFAPIALVGGVLVMRFVALAGKAYNRRSSEEFERALIAQKHVWIWAGMTVIAALAFPVVALFVAALMDVWP